MRSNWKMKFVTFIHNDNNGLIQHVFIGLQLIFGENFILNIPSTTHS
jgi:hypothetical protein